MVTNDGVTVAKEVDLPDNIENSGAAMVIEAAEKSNTEAGDGTTTTCVLAYAICKEGMRYISNGINPFKLADGLHKAKEFVIGAMQEEARPIKENSELVRIASISAQDQEIGAMIGECFKETGDDGIVTVEEGMKPGLSKEIKTGMQYQQ